MISVDQWLSEIDSNWYNFDTFFHYYNIIILGEKWIIIGKNIGKQLFFDTQLLTDKLSIKKHVWGQFSVSERDRDVGLLVILT